MKRSYVLFWVGVACLAFVIVNIAVWTPPVTPRPIPIHIGNPIQRVEVP